jgi:hypothetical protein
MQERQQDDPRIEYVMRNTHVVRPPTQSLATFGTTIIRYHMLSEPIYAEIEGLGGAEETVIRNGTVRADKPEVVTPYYLSRTEGFSDEAEEFLRQIARFYGPNSPGLMYKYQNEFGGTEVVSGNVQEVAGRIRTRLDKEDRRLEAIIRGVDDHWDLSLLKFIFDLTNQSIKSNVNELNARGLLEPQDEVPRAAHVRIERMLAEAKAGERDPSEVHRELERWGLFNVYEDRFLALFRR